MCKFAADKPGSNWYWRTACTDKTWNDPACPRHCEAIGASKLDFLSPMHASIELTSAEPNRNTGLAFKCPKEESWCCAYVGEKGLGGWSKPHPLINTTCCTIDDLKFEAERPIIYATATPPIQLSILSTSTTSTSTFFSTIPLVTSATGEIDPSSLPTGDTGDSPSGTPSGDNAQDQDSSAGLSTGAKIGLGVGIPVGVIGLAVIAIFFFLQRRRRTAASSDAAKDSGPHLLPSNENTKQSAPPYQETAMNQQGATVYRHEAPSSVPMAELPATPDLAELPPQGKR
jgi:hypothetical protein